MLESAHLSSDGDLDLDTGLDVDNDLLDDLGGGVEAVGGAQMCQQNKVFISPAMVWCT